MKAIAKGQLIVISGPPAGGKDSVRRELVARGYSIIVTTTSRPKRADDLPGDYEYVSVAQFDQLLAQGVFGDVSPVHKGYRYGTRKSELLKALDEKIVWRIDPTSAANVRTIVPSELLNKVISFWVVPESMDELERRMRLRDVDKAFLESDLRQLKIDMDFFEANKEKYDFVVVNYRDRLKEAVEEIEKKLG